MVFFMAGVPLWVRKSRVTRDFGGKTDPLIVSLDARFDHEFHVGKMPQRCVKSGFGGRAEALMSFAPIAFAATPVTPAAFGVADVFWYGPTPPRAAAAA